ncbi:MAG: Bax inhibitor-1 family protein [Myxococcota bacterium]
MNYGFQQQGGGYSPEAYGGAVAHASVEERASFITRTYLHLVGAIFAFVAIETVIMVTGLGETLLNLALMGRWSWLIFLGGFMAVSYIADKWARTSTSVGMQYAGLILYTVGEAILFAPLVLMAVILDAETGGSGYGLLGKAGLITVVLFGGLTGVVFLTRKDFSFLRSILMFGGFAAMGIIVASIAFGFSLGLFFSWAMVVFAAGSILYNTSNVMLYYRTNQHVAAALSLFASFALLLWYVLQIVMASRD